MIGVEIVGLELDGFAEMLLGFGGFAEAREIGGEIGVRFGRFWIQAGGFFEVRAGLGVLRLRGVVEAEEFVKLEAFVARRAAVFREWRRIRRSGRIRIRLTACWNWRSRSRLAALGAVWAGVTRRGQQKSEEQSKSKAVAARH